MLETKYIYGIVYGHNDRELIENVEKQINSLYDIYTTVEVISVSHAGPNPVGPVDWSAFITCEVTSSAPTLTAEMHV